MKSFFCAPTSWALVIDNRGEQKDDGSPQDETESRMQTNAIDHTKADIKAAGQAHEPQAGRRHNGCGRESRLLAWDGSAMTSSVWIHP